MTVVVVVADSVVDFLSSSLSRATIIVVLEFLLECCTVVPVKLLELLQLGLCLP
jgi:hypothetical protein